MKQLSVILALVFASSLILADLAEARGNRNGKVVGNGIGNGNSAARVQGFTARAEEGAYAYFDTARRNDLSSGTKVRQFFDQFQSN